MYSYKKKLLPGKSNHTAASLCHHTFWHLQSLWPGRPTSPGFANNDCTSAVTCSSSKFLVVAINPESIDLYIILQQFRKVNKHSPFTNHPGTTGSASLSMKSLLSIASPCCNSDDSSTAAVLCFSSSWKEGRANLATAAVCFPNAVVPQMSYILVSSLCSEDRRE